MMEVQELRHRLRVMQISSPGGPGEVFRAVYAFSTSVLHREDVFGDATTKLPVVRFEPIHGSARGWYREVDGYLLEDVICIDLSKIMRGIDLLSVLSHELCHLRQRRILEMHSFEIENDPHGKEFVEGTELIGLVDQTDPDGIFMDVVCHSGLEEFLSAEINSSMPRGS